MSEEGEGSSSVIVVLTVQLIAGTDNVRGRVIFVDGFGAVPESEISENVGQEYAKIAMVASLGYRNRS